VTVFVLVGGLALLLRGLQAYWDHLSQLSTGPPVVAPSPGNTPPATKTPIPDSSETLLAPSAEELAALGSSQPATQLKAIDTLMQRRMTPELAAAVRKSSPANEALAKKLSCLKARVPGRASIEWAIVQLRDHDAVWASDMDQCVCLVEALANRVEEDPVTIAEALFPFALSYVGRPRGPALKALSNARLKQLTPGLRRGIEEGWHSSLTVRAAFALGVPEIAPDLVERWLFDSDDRAQRAARSALAEHPGAASARLLVRAIVGSREDPELLRRLREREAAQHDASDQLVSLALDGTESSTRRQRALELLSTVGDHTAVPRLASLQAADDPVLRAYAAAAAAELKKR
jgi:HEAT repeat protein